MQTLRRKPRTAQQKLAEEMTLLKQKSFKQVGAVFETFIPQALLKPERDGAMSRRRRFSKENTFWAFFSQVLDADGVPFGTHPILLDIKNLEDVANKRKKCQYRNMLRQARLDAAGILHHVTARGIEESLNLGTAITRTAGSLRKK